MDRHCAALREGTLSPWTRPQSTLGKGRQAPLKYVGSETVPPDLTLSSRVSFAGPLMKQCQSLLEHSQCWGVPYLQGNLSTCGMPSWLPGTCTTSPLYFSSMRLKQNQGTGRGSGKRHCPCFQEGFDRDINGFDRDINGLGTRSKETVIVGMEEIREAAWRKGYLNWTLKIG